MTRSQWRGHEIHRDEKTGEWFYSDGKKVKDNPNIRCGHCGRAETPEGHDGCLGTLPGIMNACCGHGDPDAAFVQYPDGSIVKGRQI